MKLNSCPRCTKAFYEEETSLTTCTSCGYSFHSRKEIRIKAEIELTLSIYGVSKAAQMLDYSPGGAMIIYDGPALPVNSSFDLELKKMKVKRSARTMWTKKIFENRHESGLCLGNRLYSPAYK